MLNSESREDRPVKWRPYRLRETWTQGKSTESARFHMKKQTATVYIDVSLRREFLHGRCATVSDPGLRHVLFARNRFIQFQET